jgi:anti-sigma factor RsiW
MPAKRCPTSDELKTYAYGTLAVELADEVTKHLADCESCEDTVQQLSAASVDRMRDLVNAQSVPQPYVEEPARTSDPLPKENRPKVKPPRILIARPSSSS